MSDALNEILKKYQDKKVLIVGHATAITYLLINWCEISYVGPHKFNNKEFFRGSKWEPIETFKLEFDDNRLINIENI